MPTRKIISVALVNPPITGHKVRGTGEYTRRIYTALKVSKNIEVDLINFEDKKESFDLIHYPYFDPFFLTLPLNKKIPTVVTVHDLIPLRFPKYFPAGIRGKLKWWRQKFSLNNSMAIITDSFASKEDIIKFTGINKNKVSVIYLGVGGEFQTADYKVIEESITGKLNIPKEFILHVGDVNYNKNILGILRAFKSVADYNPSLNLVFVGNGFVNPSPQLDEILNLINYLNIGSKIYLLGYVEPSELAGLYNLAKLYLQPSFAEGFGLPVLEAMASGCPVVVSDCSSLPELVNDAAVLVNPYDEKDIGKGILNILNNSIKKKELIDKGLQRVKKFSWEKAAFETIKIYHKILNND